MKAGFVQRFGFVLLGCVSLLITTRSSDAAVHDARCGPDARSGLEVAVKGFDEHMRRLRQTRGAPPSLAVVTERFGELVRNRVKQLPGTVVLLYATFNEISCVFLLDAAETPLAAVMPVSIANIDRMGNELRSALRVDELQGVRAPRPRGLKLDAQPQKRSPGADPDKAIEGLSAALLPVPIRARLAGARHLIVVPLSGIGTVPFALLRPFGDGRSLIDVMSVSVAADLADAGDRVDTWGPYAPGEKALIVGNPDFSADSAWDFPSLPGAEREARFLAAFFRTPALIGRQATVNVVKQQMRDADYIFLATHAIADSREALDRSFMALAGGRMTARDIQGTRLSAGLVVLSACQTGLGQAHDGGIIGLARAFQIAGARRVVMSLWSIDDEATFHLVSRFAELLNTAAPQDALRLAMLEVRKKFPNPAHWASLVYFGTPLAFKK